VYFSLDALMEVINSLSKTVIESRNNKAKEALRIISKQELWVYLLVPGTDY
jgi:hypothetical protein